MTDPTFADYAEGLEIMSDWIDDDFVAAVVAVGAMLPDSRPRSRALHGPKADSTPAARLAARLRMGVLQ